MRIAYNPKSAEPLKVAPSGDYQNAITFDLAAHNIYARGELFKGTDTTYEVFKKHTTSNNGGSNGLVPVPSYTTTAIRFLREDGTWVVPHNSETHLYIGAKSSNNNNNNNSATSNNNTYIKLFDDTTLRHQYQIKGTGLVTVSSDASGNITINSAANNYYRPISVNGTAILENDNKALNLVQYGAVVLTPNTDTNGDYTGDVQISISEATQNSSGLLSAADKQKLDGLTFGGEIGGGGFSGVLADAFTTIAFGGNSIVAAAGNQTLTFKNGSGISLNLNPTDYSLTIAGNTMTGASSTKAGTLGFVPAPAIGKQTAYLRGDGIWNNLSTDQVYTLNGYTIGTSVENLSTSDTLNEALGKLEYKADKGVEAYNIISAAYDGDGTIENLNEILKVLEGISDTDTIQAIINKYLPLTGGTLTGPLTVNSTTALNGNVTIKGNVLPQANNTYNLGSSSYKWNNIFSNTLHGNLSGNIIGGAANQIVYQTAANTTGFISAPASSDLYLTYENGEFKWAPIIEVESSGSAGEANSAKKIKLKAVAENQVYPLVYTDPKNIGKFKSAELFVDTAGESGYNPYNDTFVAEGFIKHGSNNTYVLLGGGDHKLISDFLLKSEAPAQELTNNLTTLTKNLKVTQAWVDTGISGTNLATGTYVIQVTVNGDNMTNCIWSGTMSWFDGTCSDTEADEIILHRSGKAYSDTIYLRTIMQNSGVLKLQIAADENLSASYDYTFKFKRVI